jgi:hypothetical protein
LLVGIVSGRQTYDYDLGPAFGSGSVADERGFLLSHSTVPLTPDRHGRFSMDEQDKAAILAAAEADLLGQIRHRCNE